MKTDKFTKVLEKVDGRFLLGKETLILTYSPLENRLFDSVFIVMLKYKEDLRGGNCGGWGTDRPFNLRWFIKTQGNSHATR